MEMYWMNVGFVSIFLVSIFLCLFFGIMFFFFGQFFGVNFFLGQLILFHQNHNRKGEVSDNGTLTQNTSQSESQPTLWNE